MVRALLYLRHQLDGEKMEIGIMGISTVGRTIPPEMNGTHRPVLLFLFLFSFCFVLGPEKWAD